MSSVIGDVIEERMSTNVCNAVCNAGGKLLKVVEMQYKYGQTGPSGEKTLNLTKPVALAPPIQ